MRVEVCGSIASGKTTLAAATAGLGLSTSHERFQDNPFFAKFYSDRNAYAFETEITFLLQHYSQMHEATGASIAVADFSLALDLAYAEVTLEAADRLAFVSILRRALEKLGPPALIVRLDCDSGVELERIRARARKEEEAITLDYLDSIDTAIDAALASHWFAAVPVVRIDSHAMDFRTGAAGRAAVLQQVADALRVAVASAAPR
jgi:deoxyadenosine/deoxycytidine kinase